MPWLAVIIWNDIKFLSVVGPRYQEKGVPAPYGCHPCESTRMPDHGWRFPPRSMNQRNSMSYRPPFEDAIPVSNRGAFPFFKTFSLCSYKIFI